MSPKSQPVALAICRKCPFLFPPCISQTVTMSERRRPPPKSNFERSSRAQEGTSQQEATATTTPSHFGSSTSSVIADRTPECNCTRVPRRSLNAPSVSAGSAVKGAPPRSHSSWYISGDQRQPSRSKTTHRGRFPDFPARRVAPPRAFLRARAPVESCLEPVLRRLRICKAEAAKPAHRIPTLRLSLDA